MPAPIRHPLFDPKHPGRRHLPPFPLSPLDENEQVVLVDEDGAPIGVADKATVHGARTPRHLAFSCYGFRGDGRLLVTRRADDKATFPSVWTNTCLRPSGPGRDARRRGRPPPAVRAGGPADRSADGAAGLRLPGLRRPVIEENELCPVLVCRISGDPDPRPDEVGEWAWWTWSRFLAAAADPDSGLSPWARLQAPLLDAALFGAER